MKKEYPKMMIVSEDENYNHCTETYVLGEYKNMYICVNKSTLELIDIDEETEIILTKYAKDIGPKEEVKEVDHLLKEGDCVTCDSNGEFNMILNIANKYNVKVYEKTSQDSYKHYKHMIYSDNLLQGATTHHVSNHTIPQFIKKMIGVEDKPKVIHETINGVDVEFKNNMMFINHRDVKIVFREENVKEMLHTLEEMK